MCSIKLWDEVQFLVKLEDMLLDEMRFILNCSDYHHVGSTIEFQALAEKRVRDAIGIQTPSWVDS